MREGGLQALPAQRARLRLLPREQGAEHQAAFTCHPLQTWKGQGRCKCRCASTHRSVALGLGDGLSAQGREGEQRPGGLERAAPIQQLSGIFKSLSGVYISPLLRHSSPWWHGNKPQKKKKKKGSAGKQFEAVFALFHSQQSPNGLGSFSLAYSFLLWHLIKGPKKILVHCSNNREGLTRLAPVMPENPTKSTDLSFTPPCFTRGLQRPQCRLVHAWAAIPNHCKTFYECNFSLIHIS